MFRVDLSGERLVLLLDEKPVLSHTPDEPFVRAGTGSGSFSMSGGQWFLSEKERSAHVLPRAQYDQGRNTLRFWSGKLSVTFAIAENEGNLVLSLQRATAGINRLWLSFPARPGAMVFGAGAQFEELNLRGKRISLWVIDRQTDRLRQGSSSARRVGGKSASAFPLPLYVTEDLTFTYITGGSYASLDFQHSRSHRAEIWGLPSAITFGAAETPAELMTRMTRMTGRQSLMPSWAGEGAWFEVRGGVKSMVATLGKAVDSGAQVSALLIKDWTGLLKTAEGERIFYDWVWNAELYPRLDKLIPELTTRNVRVLANINPHLSIEGRMFAEASAKGYLVKKREGGNYISDMGGFMAGHIDLTNPDACTWFKELVKNNILALGFSGYLADMGAFLPPDAVLFSKEDPTAVHNRWTYQWAKLNRQAVREAGRGGDALFFTRTGFAGSSGQTMLSSVGDLNAAWGAKDGLPAALTSMLSLGLSGMGATLTEVGGSLGAEAGRTKELFLRWLEWAAFTPIMLLSDGGGWQFDTDSETLKMFARLCNIHTALAPYIRGAERENATNGIPLARPMFLAFPEQKELFKLHDQYMLGDELLVAPAMKPNQTERKLTLPEGYWIHIWTGRQYIGGETSVYAPLGKPPVFYRPAGKSAGLFDSFLGKY